MLRLLGVAAFGAGSLGVLGAAESEAKKKHKRRKRKQRRCRTLGATCSPNGKRTCCATQELICRANRDLSGSLVCCKAAGTVCTTGSECCGNTTCLPNLVLDGPSRCTPTL
jgi:hypothetical protein